MFDIDNRLLLIRELKNRFPWLDTDDDAGSGADVISELSDWYEELQREVR